MRKHAFTLIELLVVIAIIAILAAILFPVFAQAKLAAKKTQNLSNGKQLTLAFLMYANDYDDRLNVATNSEAPEFQDYGSYEFALQPYIKNWDIFYDPLRNLKATSANRPECWSPLNPSGRCFGFAANYGFYNREADRGLYTSAGGGWWYGKNLSAVETAASTYMIGNTNDERIYTLQPYWQDIDARYQCGNGFDRRIAGMQCALGTVRWNGKYVYGFVDGHAKTVDVDAYAMLPAGDRFTIMPKSVDGLVSFCTSPTAGAVRGDAFEQGLNCQQAAEFVVANRIAIRSLL